MGRSWQIMRDSALDAKGRDWRNIIITLMVVRRALPFVVAAAMLGALGLAARWAWIAVTSIDVSPAPATDVAAPVATGAELSAVPGWVWVAAAALFLLTVWLFRPGRIVLRPRLRTVQVFAVVIAFAGLLGVAMSAVQAAG